MRACLGTLPMLMFDRPTTINGATGEAARGEGEGGGAARRGRGEAGAAVADGTVLLSMGQPVENDTSTFKPLLSMMIGCLSPSFRSPHNENTHMPIPTQDYEALERELSAEIGGMEGQFQT